MTDSSRLFRPGQPGRLGLQLVLLICLTGCAPGRTMSARPEPVVQRRPNIVFILVDDLGWRDVGFMGSTYYETPHIDRLARQGMVFTAAYSNGPNCAPTRASLMTGQYTPRHGIYTVASSERGRARDRRLIPVPNRETLPAEALTLAEVLGSAGYVSASIGKWHLGDPPTHGPVAQGFTLNVAGDHAGSPPSYFSPYQNPQLSDGPPGEELTERLTVEALSFIEANRDRPFFLYLPYFAVHTPLQARPEVVERYRLKGGSQGQDHPVYAAMVESVDQGVGRILDRLDELGLAENTLVVFTSDNGGHGNSTSNEPLRGSKGMLYEGGIRVPLALHWPGTIEPGSHDDTPVISLDFFPTLLEVAGLEAPGGHALDGESLMPILRGDGGVPERPLFWHFPAYLQAYPGQPGPWRETPSGAIRDGDWKLIETFEDGALELYNLREDPAEERDLSTRMPDRARQLHERLIAWRRSVDAPVPTEPNPAYQLEQ